MRNLAFAACFALLLATASTQAQTPAKLTVIRAGTLIDGTSDAPRKNQLIFVRGERIEKVADGSAQIPADANVVDQDENRRRRQDSVNVVRYGVTTQTTTQK